MDYTPFEFFFEKIGSIFSVLNNVSIVGVPLGILLACFILTSMVISVFWKGARG